MSASAMGSERRTVASMIADSARAWPDETALVFDSQEISYARLQDIGAGYLGAFQRLSVQPGERVLIMLDNSIAIIGVWIGLASGGYVEVPVNTQYRGEMLRHLIRDSDASLIVTDEQYVEQIRDVAPELRIVLAATKADSRPDGPHLGETHEFLDPSAGAGIPIDRGELDEMAIMYTSGTTGPAKGAVITERHAYEYADAAAEVVALTAGDRYYAPLPLFHIAGQWAVVYACLQRGACAVIVRRFSLSSFWQDIREHRVNVSFLLGAMAQFLLNDTPRADDAENPLERAMVVPLVDDLDTFRNRFLVAVSTCFGSTEANVPFAAGFDAQSETGVGVLRPGFRVKLVGSDGLEVPIGVAGELWVSTDEPGVTLRRYHQNDEATEVAIHGPWLRTGDMFRQDEGGRFHFVDRLKDSLRKRGENISSFEVEREVRTHQDVLDCAVVGIESAYSEQDIVAFVHAAPGCDLTAEDIQRHVADRAPRFMVPDHVIFIQEFPKTPTGKIQKFELRDQFRSEILGSSTTLRKVNED